VELRIAHICERFVTGGIESLLSDLCIALKNRGTSNNILFLYGDDRNPNIDRSGFNGNPFRIAMYLRTRVDPAGIVRLRQILQRLRPDVVHCHGYYAALAALIVQRTNLRIPVLYTVHADIFRGLQRSDFVVQWVLRNCEKVTAVSDATSASVAAFTNDALHPAVIRNGVQLARIGVANQQARTQAREMFGEQMNSLVFMTVGALNKQKDHPSLFRAFAQVAKALPHARLWVVGDGPHRSRLTALANSLELTDQIYFWGSRNDVHKLLLATDVFVLASHNEGIPISVIEACCAGIPVIATNVGGLSELRERGLGILLTPTENVELLRDALLRLADPIERQRATTSVNACEWVSIERAAEQYCALYEQMKPEMRKRAAA
jgi:glycosyltransferase involved in cell wall biosynthesis